MPSRSIKEEVSDNTYPLRITTHLLYVHLLSLFWAFDVGNLIINHKHNLVMAKELSSKVLKMC